MISQTAKVMNKALSISVVIIVVVTLMVAGGIGRIPIIPVEQIAAGQGVILALGLSAIALAILKLSYREA